MSNIEESQGKAVDSVLARRAVSSYPHISVVRLLEELRRRGYESGYTVLRQRVQQLRQKCRRPPVERFETGPGLHYGKRDVMLSKPRATEKVPGQP